MKSIELKRNLDTSKAVNVGRNATQLLTDLHSVSIENSVNDLGVTIDKELNFKEHVQRVKEKLPIYSASIETIPTTVATLGLL